MNIFLWVLQALFALHTAMGAIWKFSHSAEQTMPTLKAIPQNIWLTMAGIEILCAIALILPALYKPAASLIPVAAILISVEMLIFCGLHLKSGAPANGPMIYWLVVAGFCTFVAYGRFALQPL